MAHDVKMPGALGVIGFLRQLERRIGQQLLITPRDAAAFTRPGIEVAQLDAEDCALNAFHSIIVADFVVVIALR